MALKKSFIRQSVIETISVKQAVLSDDDLIEKIFQATQLLLTAFKNENKLLLCGNGGSTTDAMHIAEELTGRYRLNRPPLPAIPLTDAAHITCVSNDYGFEEIFARGVQAYGKKGDVLLVFSTSGNSENVIRAVQKANELGMKSIALTGQSGGKLKGLASLLINVPSQVTSRIQETHICIGHIFIEMIENELFGA